MTQYIIGYSTEDAAIQSQVDAWIRRHLILDFDGKLFIVKSDLTQEEIFKMLQNIIMGDGKFFITPWKDGVGLHPVSSFPAPDKDH